MNRNQLVRAAFGAVFAGVVLTGCGGPGPQMESRSVVRVEGRVLVRGKPEKGVHVSFIPADPAQEGRPHGTTDADGKYTLETYRKAGAPPGEYAVSLYWPMPSKDGTDDGSSPPDRLGRKYADPATSGVRATVAADPTVVPTIDLK